jgi:hypothetical protein
LKLICVGGASSHCGKTAVAALLLRAFPGWAAVKITPSRPGEVCPHDQDCGACAPPDGDFEIIDDPAILAGRGKDTARFLEAGAERVLWIRALPESLPAALESALERLSEAPGVIVESTTAIPLLDGLKILVARGGVDEVKLSARRCLDRIDLVALNVPTGRAAGDPSSLLRNTGRLVPVHPMLLPHDPANRAFIEACSSASSELIPSPRRSIMV